jgi:hypothetical protein
MLSLHGATTKQSSCHSCSHEIKSSRRTSMRNHLHAGRFQPRIQENDIWNMRDNSTRKSRVRSDLVVKGRLEKGNKRGPAHWIFHPRRLSPEWFVSLKKEIAYACCNRIRNRHSSLFKEHCHFYSFATISRLADNYGELLTLSNPTPGGPSVFKRYRRPSSNGSSRAFVDEGRERSRQLYLKWWASLYGLLLFLSRYGALDLNWSIGVDFTSDTPRRPK